MKITKLAPVAAASAFGALTLAAPSANAQDLVACNAIKMNFKINADGSFELTTGRADRAELDALIEKKGEVCKGIPQVIMVAASETTRALQREIHAQLEEKIPAAQIAYIGALPAE